MMIRSTRGRVEKTRALARVLGLVAAGFILVLVMHRPTVESLTETLPRDVGDPTLNTWILSWESHALISDPSNFLEGNVFYPYGEAIKYSEMMLPLIPPFAAVYRVSGDPVLAHNLVLLGLAVFCFVATYLLARRLAGPWTAFPAAAAFTFSGYVFIHVSHLQLLTLGFVPLAFLALFRALEKRRIWDGVWLGICTALVATAAVYYGAIWFVCLAVVVVVDFFLGKPDRAWWATLVSAALVIAALVGPFAYVYASFQARTPYFREAVGLGLKPMDIVTPDPGSILYSGLADWTGGQQSADWVEHGFFIGFVTMLLAAIGFAFLLRMIVKERQEISLNSRGYELGLLAFAGAVSILLAIGPEVLGIPMPLRLFREFVPGFDKMRAVSRLSVPALLTAAVLAAWFLERLLSGRSLRVRLPAVALVMAAVLLELAVTPSRARVPEPDPIRAELAAAPEGAVLELPMLANTDPFFPFVEGPRLLASIGDWRPRFNAYSGGVPPDYPADIDLLSQFPDDRALERIEKLELRYVVLHGAHSRFNDAYALTEIEVILESVPDDWSIRRVGDDWLLDRTPALRSP